MSQSTPRNTLVLLSQASLVLLVLMTPLGVNAYYCDHGYCSAEQFCCGENLCCDYVNNTIWHLVCFAISIIVFGFVLWGLVQLLLEFINSLLRGRSSSSSNCDIEQSSSSPPSNVNASAPQRITLQYLVKHFIEHATQKNMKNKASLQNSSSSQAFLPQQQQQQL